MNNDKDKIRQQIYLGALLHDIGKFYQRASGSLDEKDDNLSENAKGLAGQIWPTTQKGYFGYQHVLWTYQFFLDNEEIFKKVFEIGNVNESTQDNCINLAIYHHQPHSSFQAIVQLADWWASGLDRSKSEEYANQDVNWGKDRYKKVLLSAILQDVNINNTRPPKGDKEWYFDLKVLNFDKEIFPKQLESKSIQSLQDAYKNLWDQFNDEFKKLPTGNFDVFAESLYFLLKKFTWCIPASTLDYPDSSLFEHSKLVAAFADCLYRYHQEKPNSFDYDNSKFRIKLKNEGSQKFYPVILLCADISGIQNFIYNISSKRAAKSLRGRSFYLQILIETITNELLKKTNTYRSNVVYSSGGKMFMLLPNTQNIHETISKYREELEQWIWNEFNGDIYVSLDSVAFAYDMDHRDAKGQNLLIESKDGYCYLGDLWKAVVDKTAQWKTKKFKSIITKNPNFFEPLGDGGATEVCSITGIESNHLKILNKKDDDEEIKVLPQVETQINIGENLVGHSYLIYSKNQQPQNVFNQSKYSFSILGSYWYIFDNSGFKNVTSIDDAIVYIENDFNFLNNQKGDKSIYGFRFYGGNKVPTLNNRIKTFEELVDKDASFKRLAILRMDVDNLSQIFINGFKQKGQNDIKDSSNFSKLSTFSFQLDLFFSGYLNEIHKKYLDKIIVVYSGGDDLFAVGDWQKVIEFAEDIRSEFREFACDREDISLSGGIAMVNEKFPIAKAADLAGEAENKAKKFVEEKNTLNFLGENISWFKEFDAVKDLKDYLYDALENQKLTKGLLQKIYVFRNMKNNNNIGWRWLSAYTFARHASEKNNSEKNNKDILDKLKVFFVTDSIVLNNKDNKFGERAIDLLAIAARWAELKMRSEK
jgi:CRISPR-associated protein Csm1